MLANGRIGHVYGPMEARRLDATMLAASGLLTDMWDIGPYVIYGDQAHPLSRDLICPSADEVPIAELVCMAIQPQNVFS